MNAILRIWLAFFALGLLSGSAFAGKGESIVLNPATGNYLITYQEDDGTFSQVTFIPATKIDPALKSEVKLDHQGDVHYGYTLSSGRDSQQDIVDIILDPVSTVTTSQPDIPPDTPPAQVPVDTAKIVQISADMRNTANYFETTPPWEGFMDYSSGQKAFRIGWGTKVANGMRPGGLATFGVKSHDLPGIILAEVSGIAPDSHEIPGEDAPTPTYDENGNAIFADEFVKQYCELISTQNFIPRPVAVPMLSVTTPFDGIGVLKQLKGNIAKWPDMTMGYNPTWPHLKLIDAATATTINASLQTAIDQLGGGNNEAAIRTLKSIRSQLDQLLSNGKHDSDNEMPHDKQEAKAKKDNNAEQAEANRHLVKEVLEFDLKYITRALGSDEKMDEEEKR